MDWFDALDNGEDHPVIEEVHSRLLGLTEYREAHGRLLALMNEFGVLLNEAQREAWLELEIALSRRWEIATAMYFNVGVDSGMAASGDHGDHGDAHALAAGLARASSPRG